MLGWIKIFSTHFWSYISTLLECYSFHTCTLGSCLGSGYNYLLEAVIRKYRKCTSYRATSCRYCATLSITLCWWLKVWTITLTVDVWSVVMFPYLSILKWWILALGIITSTHLTLCYAFKFKDLVAKQHLTNVHIYIHAYNVLHLSYSKIPNWEFMFLRYVTSQLD